MWMMCFVEQHGSWELGGHGGECSGRQREPTTGAGGTAAVLQWCQVRR